VATCQKEQLNIVAVRDGIWVEVANSVCLVYGKCFPIIIDVCIVNDPWFRRFRLIFRPSVGRPRFISQTKVNRIAKGSEMPARFIAVIIVIIVILFAIVLIAIPTWATIRMMRRHRFQFSLRTLLIFVTGVAVLLSVITSWNRWFKAQINFFDPSSPVVATLKAPATIIEDKGHFKVTYRPQHRDISEILKVLGNSFCNYSCYGVMQTLSMESDNRRELDEKLSTLGKSDILQSGCFIIQGIVKDANDKPVSSAQIYLRGPYSGLKDSESREDGTFFMSIKTPAQSGYFLQIRYGNKEMNTPIFSLDSTKPELFVIVRVR
jgi:hypothetical protein